jgi:hypothetical protein
MKNKRVDFHIEVGDYFGTLATAIDLIRQCADEDGWTSEDSAMIERLRDDLMYLQRTHNIRRKEGLAD